MQAMLFRWIGALGTTGLLLCLACSRATDPGDSRAALAEARLLWTRHGVPSYRLTLVRETSGSMVTANAAESTLGVPVVVEVRDGIVVQRFYLSTGLPVSDALQQGFPDVPGLFDRIQRAIDEEAAALQVRYDETRGYPLSIQIDQVAGVAGDEETYRVTGFEIL